MAEQSPPYTDTLLLDANRQASVEYKGGNLNEHSSVYTNKLGVGVKLNSGDKVSIHSGYVSRKGAGSDTIELMGKSTGKMITLPTLTKTQYQKMVNPTDYFGLNIPVENYSDISEIYGCEQYESSTTDYEVKDNEAYFNISYFKTTNGEGYYHLPRRFDARKSQFWEDTQVGPLVQWRWVGLFHPSNQFGSNWYANDWLNNGGTDIRTPFDCYNNGMSYGAIYDRVIDPDADFSWTPNRLKYCYSNPYRRCAADMHFYQDGQNIDADAESGWSTGAGRSGMGGAAYNEGVYDVGGVSFVWKKKNDNSRNTIYIKEMTYFADRTPRRWFNPNIRQTDTERQLEGQTVAIANNSPSRYDFQSHYDRHNHHLYLERRDPAISEYIKYTETKKISLDAGNYAPENIASELTDQLNKTEPAKYVIGSTAYGDYPQSTDVANPDAPNDEPNPPTYPSFGGGGDIFSARQQVVSTFTESTCFKALHTATSVTVEHKAWSDCRAANSLDPADVSDPANPAADWDKAKSITATNYLSAHQTIGVKRPELWDAGRTLMRTLGYRYVGWNNEVVSGDNQTPGDYSKDEPFVWADHKPLTTNIDGTISPAGGLHGGIDYVSNDANDDAGVVGKVAGYGWKQMINPYIVKQLNYGVDTVIPISWDWNETNLDALKDFFETQGKYPELFEGVFLQEKTYLTDPTLATFQTGITVDNARFLHINKGDDTLNTDDDNWKNTLGTDFYSYADIGGLQPHGPGSQLPDPRPEGRSNHGGSAADEFYGTDALFFYYDKTRKDVASGGTSDTDLYYGLFRKVLVTNPYITDPVTNNQYVIGISTQLIGGIPDMIWNNPTAPTTIGTNYGRTIGFDMHFCAYGTSCINLYAGYLSQQVKELDTSTKDITAGYPTANQGGHAASTGYPLAATQYDIQGILYHQSEEDLTLQWYNDQKPVHQFIKHRYVGAENPQLSFDTSESKFNFQQLHTPERVGNIQNAGVLDNVPIVADTNDKVYFVNKRLLIREYCPDMFPYASLQPSVVPTGQEQDTTYTTFFNFNITPYSIMDADSGIFLEDFGFGSNNLFNPQTNPTKTLTSQDWKETLWSMLGFTYDQFYTTSENQELTRQTRINNIITTDTIGKPTTNANVEPADLSQYTTNVLGAELRTYQLPCIIGNLDITTANPYQEAVDTYLPGATVTQTSAQINAAELPVKTRYPYFLIKSDIITDSNYLGSEDSGQALNIIAVVGKGQGTDDFFFTDEGQTEFTITAPKTITEIRTQILNPDGSLAKLSDDSSVIYKVVKENGASLNVADQMLQRTKKLKK